MNLSGNAAKAPMTWMEAPWRAGKFALLLAAILALAACDAVDIRQFDQPGPALGGGGSAPPPPSDSDLSGAQAATPPASSEGAGESKGEFGTGWVKAGTTAEQRQADIGACHTYALAQIRSDRRIDRDIAAARSLDDRGLGSAAFETRVNESYYKRARGNIFADCMESKGYALLR